MTQLQNLSKDKLFTEDDVEFLVWFRSLLHHGKNDGPGHGQHDDRCGQRTVSG